MNQIVSWITLNFMYCMLLCGAIFSTIWLYICNRRIRIHPVAVPFIALGHTVLMVLSVMLFAVIEAWDFSVFGRTSLFGAIFFMPLFYWIGAKVFHKDIGVVFDVFSVCVAATVMFTRFNCLLAGCCGGKPIPGLDNICWPSRELEILFYLTYIFVFAGRIRKGKTNGELYPIYMIAYGVFRFVVEFLRVSTAEGLFHIGHLWAVLSGIIGLIVLLIRRKSLPFAKSLMV